MFYRPADGHGLPHNPFSAIVSPRPIGWISSRNAEGQDNLAPYSFFNAVSYTPPMVIFASGSRKDSVRNAEESGVFCANLVGADAISVMNDTSASLDFGSDEFAHAGALKTECSEIACARVGDAPAALECKTRDIIALPDGAGFMVLGEVVGVHLRDDCLFDGRYDVTRARHLSRLGYMDYAEVKELFELTRPSQK